MSGDNWDSAKKSMPLLVDRQYKFLQFSWRRLRFSSINYLITSLALNLRILSCCKKYPALNKHFYIIGLNVNVVYNMVEKFVKLVMVYRFAFVSSDLYADVVSLVFNALGFVFMQRYAYLI